MVVRLNPVEFAKAMMKKKKQGLSHFVEILIAILVAIAVGGVFMVLSNDGMKTIFQNMIDRIINGFQG